MIKVPVGTHMFANIDESDAVKVCQYRWYPHRYRRNSNVFYARTWVVEDGKRKTMRMHNLIIDVPKGMVVDHINHDTLDNTRGNLRIASAGQNARNRRIGKTNTTGLKGVIKVKNRWVATISHEGIMYRLGSFKDKISAALAYNEAASRMHKEFAVLNKI